MVYTMERSSQTSPFGLRARAQRTRCDIRMSSLISLRGGSTFQPANTNDLLVVCWHTTRYSITTMMPETPRCRPASRGTSRVPWQSFVWQSPLRWHRLFSHTETNHTVQQPHNGHLLDPRNGQWGSDCPAMTSNALSRTRAGVDTTHAAHAHNYPLEIIQLPIASRQKIVRILVRIINIAQYLPNLLACIWLDERSDHSRPDRWRSWRIFACSLSICLNRPNISFIEKQTPQAVKLQNEPPSLHDSHQFRSVIVVILSIYVSSSMPIRSGFLLSMGNPTARTSCTFTAFEAIR